MVGALLIAALAGVGVLTSALIWAVWRVRPIFDLEADIKSQRAIVENLEEQVTQLRTKKANRASQESRARKREEEEADPLAGLPPEERALFGALEN